MSEDISDISSFNSFVHWDEYARRVMKEEKTKEVLNIIHINVRSIKKNWDQLNVYLETRFNSLDILVITETHLKTADESAYQLPGFHSVSVCRENGKGGGILIYIKKDWIAEQVEVSLDHAETIVMSVSKNEFSFLVVALYRPPSADVNLFYNEFENLLKQYNNNDQVIITGDLNIDVMNRSKYKVGDYLDLLSSYGLQNVIRDYTREE